MLEPVVYFTIRGIQDAGAIFKRLTPRILLTE